MLQSCLPLLELTKSNRYGPVLVLCCLGKDCLWHSSLWPFFIHHGWVRRNISESSYLCQKAEALILVNKLHPHYVLTSLALTEVFILSLHQLSRPEALHEFSHEIGLRPLAACSGLLLVPKPESDHCCHVLFQLWVLWSVCQAHTSCHKCTVGNVKHPGTCWNSPVTGSSYNNQKHLLRTLF